MIFSFEIKAEKTIVGQPGMLHAIKFNFLFNEGDEFKYKITLKVGCKIYPG